MTARYSIVYGMSSSSSWKTSCCLEFKSSAKGISISTLQNIKIKRGNYNVYTFKQDKYII